MSCTTRRFTLSVLILALAYSFQGCGVVDQDSKQNALEQLVSSRKSKDMELIKKLELRYMADRLNLYKGLISFSSGIENAPIWEIIQTKEYADNPDIFVAEGMADGGELGIMEIQIIVNRETEKMELTYASLNGKPISQIELWMYLGILSGAIN